VQNAVVNTLKFYIASINARIKMMEFMTVLKIRNKRCSDIYNINKMCEITSFVRRTITFFKRTPNSEINLYNLF